MRSPEMNAQQQFWLLTLGALGMKPRKVAQLTIGELLQSVQGVEVLKEAGRDQYQVLDESLEPLHVFYGNLKVSVVHSFHDLGC